ncbi:hypothetical protein [Longimycelium tulufanense]|uniref:hypothetical protein n=1 Tax=Longimycelium tulufanense TaxID=907463 RepID=UPI001666CCDD|nr:hypothetical protein [Longimycelium tulufanense]
MARPLSRHLIAGAALLVLTTVSGCGPDPTDDMRHPIGSFSHTAPISVVFTQPGPTTTTRPTSSPGQPPSTTPPWP